MFALRLSLVLFCSLQVLAMTLRVPADWPTIPQALQAAQDGDTVLVAPGQHAGPVDFLGRQVRVASTDGPQLTTITSTEPGALVRFVHGEGPGAELEGFTLSDGSAPEDGGACGGAIRVEDASPLIRGNIILGNSAVLGGGACLLGGGARLEDNEFIQNGAEVGGALYAQGGAPLIQGNGFQDNHATGAGYGGALALEACAAQVRFNRFTGNTARLGGAISCRGSGGEEATLERNSLARNGAPLGGGVYLFQCAPILRSTVLAFATEGAALWCNQAEPLLTCCDLYSNAGGDTLCGLDLGGNFREDPLFCDLEAADLRLATGSPCWSSSCGPIGAWDVDCDGVGLAPRPAERPRAATLGLSLWPNPANAEAWISLELPVAGPLDLRLYDLRGGLADRSRLPFLMAGPFRAPLRQLGFNLAVLPGGLYLLRAEVGGTGAVCRLLLLP